MIFIYDAVDQTGAKRNGSIDAINVDVAISSLQKRGFVITSINEADKGGFLSKNITLLDRVSMKDIVILSRQLSTLFDAQVSALRIFRLLSAETENAALAKVLTEVSSDLQGGASISVALGKHPKIFNDFYVSMVKAGEESGKLNDTFLYLADYLDRSYELTSKVKGALIYPAFVVVTFITVMILMFTMVIPKISTILVESGVEIPIYTRVIMSISNFLVSYGFVILALLMIVGFFVIRYVRTAEGKLAYDRFKLSIPYVNSLFRKLYLARMSDNMSTMLSSGIPIVHSLELTSNVINNSVYHSLLTDVIDAVKGGKTLSESLSAYPAQIPGIMTQMMKVGEETGELGNILKTVAKFYTREVTTAINSMVSLIEPLLIVFLGGGVAVLLASVLIPIYNIASAQ